MQEVVKQSYVEPKEHTRGGPCMLRGKKNIASNKRQKWEVRWEGSVTKQKCTGQNGSFNYNKQESQTTWREEKYEWKFQKQIVN